MNTFSEQLAVGKIGESAIAKVLRQMGYHTLPVYEIAGGTGKGPVLYTGDEQIIAADLLAFRDTEKGLDIKWIEAKAKSAFTWHRNTRQWVTGIDERVYEQYLKLNSLSRIKLRLMFLQKPGEAKDTPEGLTCPTGLYYGDIDYLSSGRNVHHRDTSKGKRMVYWAESTLTRLCTLEHVRWVCSPSATKSPVYSESKTELVPYLDTSSTAKY